MRKRIKWENASFELPYFDYHYISPKPGHVYCLYGEQNVFRFRTLFRFAKDIAYWKRLRFYNLLPEYTHLWNDMPNELLYAPRSSSHQEIIDGSDLLSFSSQEEYCRALLQRFETDIRTHKVKTIIVDTIHCFSGRVLTHFLKSINKLARKQKVSFFIGSDTSAKLDYDCIYYVKPSKFKQLFLYVDFFMAIMQHPTLPDYLVLKIWKSRSNLPKPAYKGKGWRYDDENDNVFVLWASLYPPFTINYHGFHTLPFIFRRYVRPKLLHFNKFK